VQDVIKQLNSIKKVLLIKFKVKETLQKELVTKFYNLKEDLQKCMPKED
jgi:hypothetical protein